MRIESAANQQSFFVGNQMRSNKNEKDGVLNGIQEQITNAQEQMKQLSENEELSAEEKMDKRKEIQQQIADLNKQLSERKMQMKQEEQEEQAEKMKGTQDETQGQDQAMIKDFIKAGTALSNASSLGHTRIRLNGEKSNLASQIESDAARGIDTSKKQESLSDLEFRINNITKQIGKELGEVTREGKKSNETEKADEANEEDDKNIDASDPRNGNPAVNILV